MDVHTPADLDQALELKAQHPDALVVQGGTDVLVTLNFDRARPAAVIALDRLHELRGWHEEGEELVLGAGLTYTEAMKGRIAEALPALAEAARTVGSPQIRNRGTIGGNLGTASPAGDALPPLLVEGASVEVASERGRRALQLEHFLVGPKQNALAPDELITGVRVRPSHSPQTFMKVGPRNAMVIAVCSLAVEVDDDRGEVRVAFGSCGPVATLVRAPRADGAHLPDLVASAASPIDDVRGTAAYRRHALRVLTERALERCTA
jgi:CO/xanthine dehydrogenase FAD-binding subunit